MGVQQWLYVHVIVRVGLFACVFACVCLLFLWVVYVQCESQNLRSSKASHESMIFTLWRWNNSCMCVWLFVWVCSFVCVCKFVCLYFCVCVCMCLCVLCVCVCVLCKIELEVEIGYSAVGVHVECWCVGKLECVFVVGSGCSVAHCLVSVFWCVRVMSMWWADRCAVVLPC